MANELTFDALWEGLKTQSDESKELLEVSESVATIINNIVKARISKGLTQRELANSCGIKQSAIARMERLQAIPRLDTVVKIAKTLDIRICTENVYAEETVSEAISITVDANKQGHQTGIINYNTYSTKFKPYKLVAAVIAGGI